MYEMPVGGREREGCVYKSQHTCEGQRRAACACHGTRVRVRGELCVHVTAHVWGSGELHVHVTAHVWGSVFSPCTWWDRSSPASATMQLTPDWRQEGFWRLHLISPPGLLQGSWDYRSFTLIPGIELRFQAYVAFSLTEPAHQPTEGNFDLV